MAQTRGRCGPILVVPASVSRAYRSDQMDNNTLLVILLILLLVGGGGFFYSRRGV